MHLTAVEFAKLISDLRCDMRPEERRQNPRAPTRSRVEVIRVHASATTPAAESLRVRDISRNGLGLMSNDKPEEGQRFLVLLPKNTTETFVLLCEVARVTRLPGDAYGMGLSMVRRVNDEERIAFMRGSAETRAALLAKSPSAPVVAPAPAAAA
jgi:hypothetical protein